MTQRDRYILDRAGGRRLRARDAMLVVAIAVLLLVLFEGRSIRNQGKQMQSGIERTAVLAVGEPAGWIADKLPLADALDDATAFLSPDDDISGPGGFEDAALQTGPPAGGGGAPGTITPEHFDPTDLGQSPSSFAALRTLLGHRRLDDAAARRRARPAPVGPRASETVRDAAPRHRHLEDAIVDWGKLSTSQIKSETPGRRRDVHRRQRRVLDEEGAARTSSAATRSGRRCTRRACAG